MSRRATNTPSRRWLQRLVRLFAAFLLVITASQTSLAQELPQILAPLDMPDMTTSAESIAIPPLPEGFVTRDEGWLRLSYPQTASAWAPKLIEAAQEAKRDLAAELGRPVLHEVEVRVARTPQELARLTPVGLPPPEYAEGVAYARVRLIVLSLVAPNAAEPPVLTEVLKHELAHVALHDAVGGMQVPRWFNEGFAVHASGESSLVRTRTLWTATLGNRVLPMSELDKTFPAHSELAGIAYAQSADFVRFLLRRQDRDRFQMFIERVGRGEKFERAIQDAYASDLRRLEFQWREEIKKRYSWAPVLLGGGLLWVGAIVLVALAWWKRRRDSKRTLARWTREEAAEARRAREAQEQQRIHVTIQRAESLGFPPPSRRDDAPAKVEHGGRWHTLH